MYVVCFLAHGRNSQNVCAGVNASPGHTCYYYEGEEVYHLGLGSASRDRKPGGINKVEVE